MGRETTTSRAGRDVGRIPRTPGGIRGVMREQQVDIEEEDHFFEHQKTSLIDESVGSKRPANLYDLSMGFDDESDEDFRPNQHGGGHGGKMKSSGILPNTPSLFSSKESPPPKDSTSKRNKPKHHPYNQHLLQGQKTSSSSINPFSVNKHNPKLPINKHHHGINKLGKTRRVGIRPGQKALQEIRQAQNGTNLLIPKLPFRRMIKGLMDERIAKENPNETKTVG